MQTQASTDVAVGVVRGLMSAGLLKPLRNQHMHCMYAHELHIAQADSRPG